MMCCWISSIPPTREIAGDEPPSACRDFDRASRPRRIRFCALLAIADFGDQQDIAVIGLSAMVFFVLTWQPVLGAVIRYEFETCSPVQRRPAGKTLGRKFGDVSSDFLPGSLVP